MPTSRQKFKGIPPYDDQHIFQSSLVPIRLQVNDGSTQPKVIWKNPVTSSSRFCRPIRVRFIKESKDVIKDEFKHINEQISRLEKTKFSNGDRVGFIRHTLIHTMVDGKVIHTVMGDICTRKCYICGDNQEEFMKMKTYDHDSINPDALSPREN
ncbi:hypothetical protein DMENIID0001_041250 [Sergentomyia squamirostris]